MNKIVFDCLVVGVWLVLGWPLALGVLAVGLYLAHRRARRQQRAVHKLLSHVK